MKSKIEGYYTKVELQDTSYNIGVIIEDGLPIVVSLDFNSNLSRDFTSDLKYDFMYLEPSHELFAKVINELASYLYGKSQSLNFPIKFITGTPFQQKVWNELLKVPYGKTTTYKKLAEKVASKNYARAVGNAVGSNPILIKVPCHRVLKHNNELGGFSGGIGMKIKLLRIEKIDYKG